MSEPTNPEVTILNAALELPAAERTAYLDQACAGDVALRTQVEALLKADAQAEGFMESSPAGFDFKRTVQLNIPLTEKPGDRIGRYKLLQQIGEGGCGVVYMAEQEEPVRRRVALKVIKLGMDTKSVIARFEAERQALALMDHPNIAKVLDAGATDTGRPYFVMELVRGIKITDFCDENRLSTTELLKLFIQVCQAIQHAHQKSVIHRDIKPSNILVTVNDGVPVPKVIDFGIAKATQGRLTNHTLFTAFEQFIGTPAYMSPEQAVMTSLDIDTRSDIYSLGVLLYELLTGRTPFDQKELLAAGLDEMRRTIREVEPVKPSTRLTQELVADDVRRRAAKSEIESASSRRRLQELRGDLDWIVMKCLEKDRTRRYETANGLAADIQRHLKDEPIVARPPSKLYEFQKTVRRHKFGFAAAAGLMVVLSVGVLVSTLEAVRATRAEQEQERQRQIAETKEKKSQQVAQFLKEMLKGAGPYVALGRDTALLRGILDKTADQVNNDLANQPEVRGELLNVSGWVYWSIDELAKSEAAFRQALVVQRKALGKNHPDLADTLFGLAQVLYHERKLEESETFYRESLEIRRKVYGNEHWTVAACLNNLSSGPLRSQGKWAEAESYSREGLAMKRRILARDSAAMITTPKRDVALGIKRRDEHELAISLRDLGLILHGEGKLAEAEGLYREALTIFKKASGDMHPDVAFTLDWFAGVLSDAGKLAEAESTFREALVIQRKLYARRDRNLVATLNGLARILERQGKLAEATALLEAQTNSAAEKKSEPR
jgi:eukaryotic-like serine/threonine-protein kinase